MSKQELKSAIQFIKDNNFPILGVRIGWKKTNNEYIRGEKSIVFSVEQKKPLSELSEDEIIPSSIVLDGQVYKTDVINFQMAHADACYTVQEWGGPTFPGSDQRHDATDLTIRGMRFVFTSGTFLTDDYPADGIGHFFNGAASGLMGGQQVVKYPDGFRYNVNGQMSYSTGTMGLIAVDNEDNRLVGVTNTHVACDRKIRNSDRFDGSFDPTTGITTSGEIDDPYSFVHRRPRDCGLSNGELNGVDLPRGSFPPQLLTIAWDYQSTVRSTILQFPPLASDSAFIQTAAFFDEAAQYSDVLNSGAFMLKRYSPFALGTDTATYAGWSATERTHNFWNVWDLNQVDCCIFDIDDKFLADYSYKLREPDGANDMLGEYLEFATETEIDNMLTDPPAAIYAVGRTTGPKGFVDTATCRLECVATNGIAVIGFPERGVDMVSGFTECIYLEYEDGDLYPGFSGDSGSIYVADLDGTGDFKVIGLNFAGSNDRTEAIGNRIDNVASKLNISAWTAATSLDTSRPSKTVVTRPYTEGDPDQDTITIDGQTYYNVGLAKAHRILTQSLHTIATQDGDTLEYHE